MPSDIICIALQFFQDACRNGGLPYAIPALIAVFPSGPDQATK